TSSASAVRVGPVTLSPVDPARNDLAYRTRLRTRLALGAPGGAIHRRCVTVFRGGSVFSCRSDGGFSRVGGLRTPGGFGRVSRSGGVSGLSSIRRPRSGYGPRGR